MLSNVETNSLLASAERQNHHSDFFDDELSSGTDDETLKTSNVVYLNNFIKSHLEPNRRKSCI